MNLVLQLMVLGPEDVSRVSFGILTEQAIKTLRLLKDSFGIVFKIKENLDNNTVTLSCFGTGMKNVSRKAT